MIEAKLSPAPCSAIQYSKEVDLHIYGPGPDAGCETEEHWIDLAIAAIDQCGLSVAAQLEIREQLNAYLEYNRTHPRWPNVCVSDGPADAPELTRSAKGPFAARNGSTT